MQQQNV